MCLHSIKHLTNKFKRDISNDSYVLNNAQHERVTRLNSVLTGFKVSKLVLYCACNPHPTVMSWCPAQCMHACA